MKLRFLDILGYSWKKTKFEKTIFVSFLRNLADRQSDEWMDGQMDERPDQYCEIIK